MIAVVAQDSAIILREWRGQLLVDSTVTLCVLLLIAVLGYRVDRANRATQLHALRDGLTELANRRCFNETIEREFKRAARSRLPLSLIMVDIDLFKSFNDQYGHPAGDACLRTISATVQGVLRRPSDLAARYGGEEIAIILPETDVAGAIQIVTDMLIAVRACAIPHEGSAHGIVTVSAGIASYNPARRDADSTQLVEKADAALYAAKALGRNAFTVHAATETASSAAKRRVAA
jgi:diguanylate cyclase (GGDEF)-like protein